MNSSLDTFPNASVTKISRDQRWEARRKVRLGIEPPQQLPNQLFTQPEPAPKIEIPMESKPTPLVNPPQPAIQSVFNPSPTAQNSGFDPSSNLGQIARLQQGMMPPSSMLLNSSPAPEMNFPRLEDKKIIPVPIEYERAVPKYEDNRKSASIKTPPESVVNSFFTNPVSEAEQKRKRMLEEYRVQMQVEAAHPKAQSPEGYARHRADFGAGPNPQDQQQNIHKDIAKRQYQIELQRQIAEKESSKRRRTNTPPKEEYFPFGKPGAGAPYRDVTGKIVANRPPRFNENDPNFLRPRQFYEKLGVPGDPNTSPPRSYAQLPNLPPQSYPNSQTYLPNPPQSQYQPPPQSQYQPPLQSQYQPPLQSQYQPPLQSQYQPPQSQYQPPQSQYQYQPPAPSFPNFPSQNIASPDPIPSYNPPVSQFPSSVQSYPPADNPPGFPPEPIDLQDDYSKQMKVKQKNELNRALQEQIEERRRKKEEEKRQQMLEEKLEEERLERERKKMEEEYKREQEKRKKEFQDLQSFNSNVVHAPPPPPNKRRRPKTPIDFPPTLPPAGNAPVPLDAQLFEPARIPSRELMPPTKNQQQDLKAERFMPNPPADISKQIQSSIENELMKIKNEMNHQQNELKSTLVQLKNETLLANEQRYEAQKELERIKEEMRKRNLEEEIRQREIFQAIVSPNLQPGYQPTRLPPLQPAKLELPRGREASYIDLDKSQSLVAESKFIPVPIQDLTIKEPVFDPKPLEIKKAYHLDDVFPSLPEGGAVNLSTLPDRTTSSGFSTLGIDAIVSRNEERLHALENYEKMKRGESGMDQIDELLHSYLHKVPAVPPSRGSSKYGHSSALNVIREYDEDGTFSLPSRESTRSKRLSNFTKGNVFTKNANLIL